VNSSAIDRCGASGFLFATVIDDVGNDGAHDEGAAEEDPERGNLSKRQPHTQNGISSVSSVEIRAAWKYPPWLLAVADKVVE
jgi:hypothetical protein